jgi:hypothetical protein
LTDINDRRKGFLTSAGVHFCEAVAAINRATFLGSEGDTSDAAAVFAGSFEHFALTAAGFSHVSALFAALGLVLEALFSIKFLFSRCEDEFLSAVLTS